MARPPPRRWATRRRSGSRGCAGRLSRARGARSAGHVCRTAACGRLPNRGGAGAPPDDHAVMERADASTPVDARARIVDAGVRCIAREGVAAASMAAIALDAGVSKALLHSHYHDRATLLAEVV